MIDPVPWNLSPAVVRATVVGRCVGCSSDTVNEKSLVGRVGAAVVSEGEEEGEGVGTRVSVEGEKEVMWAREAEGVADAVVVVVVVVVEEEEDFEDKPRREKRVVSRRERRRISSGGRGAIWCFEERREGIRTRFRRTVRSLQVLYVVISADRMMVFSCATVWEMVSRWMALSSRGQGRIFQLQHTVRR